MIFTRIILCMILLVGLVARPPFAQSSTNQQSEQRLERFEHQLESLQRALLIPGMSAAVIKDGKVIWARGFGFADVENRVAATENTPYRIASLTKTFASTLVMQLIEQGKISLDDPMSKYSSNYKDDSVKVRHVLSHTTEGTPGEKYNYNGNRFATLDAVLEKASGRSFRDLLRQTVLDPLGMSDSVPGQNVLNVADKSLDADTLQRYSAVLSRLAKPYTPYRDGQIALSPYPPRGISAAAGLVSTVMDLAKYDAAVDKNRFIKREVQSLAWSPMISTAGRELPYGLGWFVQNVDGVKTVWHYGQWPTFSALYLKVPEKGLTLIVLTNSGALSEAFNLGGGDLTRSALADTFLRLFVFEEKLGRGIPDPDWSLDKDAFSAQLDKLKKQARGYTYKWEQRSFDSIRAWRAGLRKPPPNEPPLGGGVLTIRKP